eukprot:356262-Chlamydomonas_euryale.AAC.8
MPHLHCAAAAHADGRTRSRRRPPPRCAPQAPAPHAPPQWLAAEAPPSPRRPAHVAVQGAGCPRVAGGASGASNGCGIATAVAPSGSYHTATLIRRYWCGDSNPHDPHRHLRRQTNPHSASLCHMPATPGAGRAPA